MEEEQKKQAIIAALRLLAAGDKSEHEVALKLRQKGFAERNIQAAIEHLRGEGFLSDQIFAEKLANRILHTKRSGTHKLAFELKKKHVPESIRKTVLQAINPEEQRLQAFEIASAKVASFRDSDPRVLRKKLYDFLIRKGYDFQLAQEASQRVISEVKKTQIDDENG